LEEPGSGRLRAGRLESNPQADSKTSGLRYDLFTRHTEKLGKVTTFVLGPNLGSNGSCLHPANGYCADGIQSANIPAGDPGCDTPTQLAKNVLAGICGPGGFSTAKSLGKGNHHNFGPRLGVAYDPWGNGKTAIRGGFGLSYEGTLYNPLSNSRWKPAVFILLTVLTTRLAEM